MVKLIKSLSVILCLSSALTAQPTIDYSISIKSTALQSEQSIQVYLPKSYESERDKRYPVLYILDGQWFFYNGVAIRETLRGESLMPETIIIGVDYKSRAYHDSLHFNLWDELSGYIQNELVPFVDKSYRTTDERIVFGWENPSYMVCEFLFTEKPLFSGYIVSNGGYVQPEMLEAYKKYQGPDKYLFLTNSKKDIYTIQSSESFAEKLKEKNPSRLNWKYQLFDQEVHESLAYTALYQGLRFYYHNYSSKVFSSAQEFHDEGGLKGLKNYFQGRSERFGTDPAIDNSTKNSLIWLAWKHDDFASFDYFMTEFADVLTTKRYASAYWQNRLGQFYLKNEDADHAIEYFTRGIEKYPDDKFMAKMHAGLGKSYQLKNDKSKAISSLKKAIKLAKISNDSQLEDYQLLLKSLK